MPTYEYECNSCAHRFEVFQKISEAPIKICPRCYKSVRRLISAGIGIIFKGSGFYSTDNKKSTAVNNNKKSSTKKSETQKKKESTKESA